MKPGTKALVIAVLILAVAIVVAVVVAPEAGGIVGLVLGTGALAAGRKRTKGQRQIDGEVIRAQRDREEAERKLRAAREASDAAREELRHDVEITASGRDRRASARRLSRFFGFGGKKPKAPAGSDASLRDRGSGAD